MRTVRHGMPGIMRSLYGTCKEELEVAWGACPGSAHKLVSYISNVDAGNPFPQVAFLISSFSHEGQT